MPPAPVTALRRLFCPPVWWEKAVLAVGERVSPAMPERSAHHLPTPIAVPEPFLFARRLNSSDNETNCLQRGLGLQPEVGPWQQLLGHLFCSSLCETSGFPKNPFFNNSLLSRASLNLFALCEGLSRTRPGAEHPITSLLSTKPPGVVGAGRVLLRVP